MVCYQKTKLNTFKKDKLFFLQLWMELSVVSLLAKRFYYVGINV